MKPAEQDKAQIVVRRIVDQPLCQLKIRESRLALSVNAIELHCDDGVASAKILPHAPIEERSQRKHVALGRARHDAGLRCIVVSFAMTGGDVGRWDVLNAVGKYEEARALAVRTHFAVAVCLELVL